MIIKKNLQIWSSKLQKLLNLSLCPVNKTNLKQSNLWFLINLFIYLLKYVSFTFQTKMFLFFFFFLFHLQLAKSWQPVSIPKICQEHVSLFLDEKGNVAITLCTLWNLILESLPGTKCRKKKTPQKKRGTKARQWHCIINIQKYLQLSASRKSFIYCIKLTAPGWGD